MCARRNSPTCAATRQNAHAAAKARAETGMSTTTTPTPELPGERCGNCLRALPADDASGVMHAGGWLHCQYHRVWEYCSPHHPCHFEPSRWAAKSGTSG
jgi:hypothetical protein